MLDVLIRSHGVVLFSCMGFGLQIPALLKPLATDRNRLLNTEHEFSTTASPISTESGESNKNYSAKCR